MKRKALAINLKITLAVVFAVVIALFSFLAPELGKQIRVLYPQLAYLYAPCLVFVWVTALPLILSIFKGWQIATEIGRDNTYCEANSKRLMLISRLILTDVVLYCLALVAIVVGNLFHPAMYLIITLLIFAAAMISVVASALSHYILRYREKNKIE